MAEEFEDKRVHEALDLLNELAREKKADFLDMISDTYSDLKSALREAAESLQARETFPKDKRTENGLVAIVDGRVRTNPWPYIRRTAVGFLILGLLLGRRRR